MLLLAACASVPETTDQPVKSPNDKYDYRLLTLDNDMQVLLISAPDSPKAAAALAVMVGSGDNPPGRGGLAHFLEHMLFLGTDKYPDAAEYERYITEHGGSRNAYTSFDHTNYFFDINAQFLPEALDRFAQFFIAPRFDEQYVEREKKAVEAEYQMGLKSDGRRGLDVLQEVMNPEHPYSQFAVGSLETLADHEDSLIRDELIDFYDRYYSANIMRLAVLGNESLDELEALVRPMFSQVPNRAVEHERIAAPLFSPGSLPMAVRVQPLATQRQLEVSFPIPDYRAEYHTKPVSYLGNLVGHEGEGSLLSVLKAEGLAESLSAGAGLGWRGGSLFSVSITLTERGAEHHDRVLQLLFAYLDMLRAQGPRDWLYQEQSQLSQLGFRFREPGNPASYVTSLVSGMHYYAPRDVLQGPYIMDDYEPAMLRELVGLLRPDNALVVLNDQDVATDRVSQHYQVPYAREPLDTAPLALAGDDAGARALQLPAPNDFIAQDLSLVALEQPLQAVPQVQMERERQTLWYMPDEEFRVPKGAIFINFRSTEVGQSPRQSALASLYTAVLSDHVNEFSYPAHLAGLSFSFYTHAQGISLRLNGYNDKQLYLLSRLLDVISDPGFDPQRVENIRADMIRALRNSVAKRPSSQVMDDLGEAVWHGRWGEEALIAQLQQADLDALMQYARAFWRGATAEALVYGNFDAATVPRLSQLLEVVVSEQAAPEMPGVRLLRLAPGETLQYAVQVAHDDSVVAWYLQGAGDSWRDRAATALSAQVMKSGFFQQLRTEQQLGYVASAFNWPQLDVPGLVMLIQSPRVDAAEVARRMDDFMQGVLPDLDEEQFARHRAALVSDILRPDKNLRERADFYWSSIARRQYDFDGRQALAEAVENLSLEDWRAYFTRVFLQQRHALQVVAPGRWGTLPANGGPNVDSAAAVKEGRAVYHIR
ncbi:MAG: peptidase M16 [Halioglobus sp.]|nr:peptidase M16 [Halioglobus sp.]